MSWCTRAEPLKEGMELTGPIEATIYLSSDRKDTDVTVKVLDVYPDKAAHNLDETIQRVRYREGYDKPPVFMEAGKVYKVALQPMTTSNYFAGRVIASASKCRARTSRGSTAT